MSLPPQGVFEGRFCLALGKMVPCRLAHVQVPDPFTKNFKTDIHTVPEHQLEGVLQNHVVRALGIGEMNAEHLKIFKQCGTLACSFPQSLIRS